MDNAEGSTSDPITPVVKAGQYPPGTARPVLLSMLPPRTEGSHPPQSVADGLLQVCRPRSHYGDAGRGKSTTSRRRSLAGRPSRSTGSELILLHGPSQYLAHDFSGSPITF